MRRPLAICDLIPGDTLTSKNGDFVLLSRAGERFTWLDLHEKQFTCELNPTTPVPTSYTVLRWRRHQEAGLVSRVGEVWEQLSFRASNGKISLLYLVVRTDEPVHYILCLEKPHEDKVFEFCSR